MCVGDAGKIFGMKLEDNGDAGEYELELRFEEPDGLEIVEVILK